MALATTLLAVCLVAVTAEAQGWGRGWNGFNRGFPAQSGAWSSAGGAAFGGAAAGRFPFGGFFPQIYQPPRLPYPFQTFPVPQLPGFGGVPIPPVDYSKFGGTSSGVMISSSSNGQGGMTIVSTNNNGDRKTFLSTPETGGEFVSLSSPGQKSPSPAGMTRLMQETNFLLTDISNFMKSFDMPEIKVPEIDIPEIPVFEFKPIDMKAGTSNSNFKVNTYMSKVAYAKENDEKPKIVSELYSMVNDNGKVKEKYDYLTN